MADAIWRASPNFGARRDGATAPSLIVLHYTAMASASAALDRLCDPAFEVSAHYLIGRDGTLFQMVQERDRAWHAGAGQWGAVCDVNSHSIGIELDNDGLSPFSEPLMDRLEHLLKGLMPRWSIPRAGVIGHSDLAPHRKIDPGPRFDWARLVRGGFAHRYDWPATPEGLSALGYAVERFGYDACLSAYRLRAFAVDDSAPAA